jgi:hypothetical protein
VSRDRFDVRRQEHVPTLEHLEEDADRIVRELAKLMEQARDRLRELQDLDAETSEEPTGGALAARHRIAYELRVMGRQLMRAHLLLVPTCDERAGAAGKALGWLLDAEREDRPWKAAAA